MNKQKIVAQKRGFIGTAKVGNIDGTVLSLARCEYNRAIYTRKNKTRLK